MTRKTRYRMMSWSFLLILALAILIPTASSLLWLNTATATAEAPATNPRADYWREVRSGEVGYTTIQGVDRGILIQNAGQNWRQLRNAPIATYGAYLLIGVIGAIGLFYLLRGKLKLEHPRTGIKILRWSFFERLLHWYTAILFIILAITGLSLLYGRAVLIPLLGKESFAAYASYAHELHNFLGIYFAGGVILMVLLWLRHNIPIKADLDWFLKGGGMIGHGHPSAGRMNGGEKTWYWVVAIVGLTVCATGLFLHFPSLFEQTRNQLQTAHLLHVTLALAWIAFTFGHIYIGTMGSEGSLEGMVTGYVDESWAKQHHDLWYEELKQANAIPNNATEQTDKSTAPTSDALAHH
ncbi:formate dehydrogenase, gamma subunit [Beggiatoa alba B18LD]|uniref:Formate dehydrogenase, gamma subunit n=1 Tax=Beggiatoa alba B18LD TaxID=395493 RepID=I3CCR6_9GAMM|nr:formate dehydrogenase subunit gamma [Beggiatoa alba]EIJ41409.1 formate dehydrogenase, gamma subunit [Beggiatoa alba B18LD]